MAANRKLRIISLILVLLMFASSAQAQPRDWQAVQNLNPGTLISVKARKTFLCSLEHVTDDELVCNVPHPILGRSSRMTFPRAEIREVRLAPSQTKHGWIGAGIGAGVGAAVGASGKPPRGSGLLIGTFGGALIGGVAGGIVSIFRRGKLIYKR